MGGTGLRLRRLLERLRGSTVEHAHDVRSFMTMSSSPPILTSLPDHLPNSTKSPSSLRDDALAMLVAGAGAHEMTSPSCGFS